ncbi:MAG: methionine--tRNA ligase [bacterium]|nr:methionine--tRNA ligase [bacterium]
MKNKFYITTTLPYVNAEPHIGFSLEIVQADVIARYQRALGKDVFFNTGTDEHGLKIYRKALEENKNPQDYVDEYAAKYECLKRALNLSYTNFIRTTDAHHVLAAQKFWIRCLKNGDIYKKNYKIKYCVGCELEKTDSELAKGKCPIHPNLSLEQIEEENYFFRFSKYRQPLLDFYKKYPDFVIPVSRFAEVKSFIRQGLRDFSVSRLKEKMPWGVPVPGDDSQVFFVWFDALINYISALGWPEQKKNFRAYWGNKRNPNALQVAGKDNLRQQSAIWQAMLMSAGLPNSRKIIIHGFITVAGQKMSKSLGNVVSPFELVKKYGTDPVRYFLLREIPPTEDGDFTYEKFESRYNSDLANGLGNLAARVITLAKISNTELPLVEAKVKKRTEFSSPFKFLISKQIQNPKFKTTINKTWGKYHKALGEFKFNEALVAVWNLIGFCDRYIEKEKPWEKSQKQKEVIGDLLLAINEIAKLLEPFLPETSEKIFQQLKNKKSKSLFPRI